MTYLEHTFEMRLKAGQDTKQILEDLRNYAKDVEHFEEIEYITFRADEPAVKTLLEKGYEFNECQQTELL